MEIISQIFQFITEFWHRIIPFYIVNEYDHAIILRLGKFKKECSTGFHFKIPLVDNVYEVRKTVATINVNPQTLTTKDEKTIVISSVIKYNIEDPVKYFMNVENASDVLNDVAQAKIRSIVSAKTWEELTKVKNSDFKAKIAEDAKNWGINIHYITITDLAQIKTFRLIQH